MARTQWYETSFEGYYVNRKGQIYSEYSQKTLTPFYTGINRDRARVAIGGVQYAISAILCETFYGPRPRGHVAHYINGDPTDHRVDNLRWARWGDVHKKRMDAEVKSGKLHPRASLNRTQIKQIKKKYLAGVSYRELAAEYGVHHATIGRMIRKQTYAGIS